MTPEAKQLLKDKPELCKEIAQKYRSFWKSFDFKASNPYLETNTWEMFLKKHTAKDWEILSFKACHKGEIAKLVNGRYRYDCVGGEFTLEEGIKAVGFNQLYIHSVRRSDGEVFKVGDMIQYGEENRKGSISEFKFGEVYKDTLFFVIDKWMHCEFHNITKLKPLFTTEDGVDYFKGGGTIWEVYGGNKDCIADVPETAIADLMPELEIGKRLAFSTREAAEAWVESKKVKPAWERLRKLI